MANQFHYSHLYSVSSETAPASSLMQVGEMALGLKEGHEKLWAKNNDNLVIDLGDAIAKGSLKILKVTTGLPANVKESYKLISKHDSGEVALGDEIQIVKDSSLTNFYLGHVDDHLTDEDPVTHESPTTAITVGTGDTALVYVMQIGNGNYKLVAIDVQDFLEESEFGSGVTANADHMVHGVVDPETEKDTSDPQQPFLTVGADGFKVSGIKEEINRKISALDAVVGTQTVPQDKHVAVEVTEVDGRLTHVVVTEDDIASDAELEVVKANVAEISGDVADNAAAIQTLQGDVQALDGRLDTAESNISTLSGSVAANASAIQSLQGDVQTINGELEVIDGRLDTAEGNIVALSGTVADNTTAITKLQQDVAWDESAIAGLRTDVDANASAITEIEEDIHDLDGRLTTAEGNITTLSGEVAANTEAISDIEGEMMTEEQVNDLIEVYVGSAVTSSNTVTDIIYENELIISSAFNELNGRIYTISGMAEDNAAAIEELADKVDDADGDIASLSGDVTANTAAIQTLQGDVQALDGRLGIAESNISAISGAVDTNTANIQAISGDVATNAANIQAISGDVAENAANIQAISGEVAENSTNIQAISGDVAENIANIQTISGDVTTNAANIQTLSGDVAESTANIQAISGDVEVNTTNIQTLSGEVAENTAAIAEIEGEMMTEEQVNELVEAYVGSAVTTSMTVTEIIIRDELIVTSSLNEINTRIRTVSGTVESATSAISDVVSSVTQLNERVDDIEEDIDDVTSAISDVVTSVEQLSGRVDDIENDIESVASDIESVSGVVSGQAASIADLDERVGELESGDTSGVTYALERIEEIDYTVSHALINLDNRMSSALTDDDGEIIAYALTDLDERINNDGFVIAQALTDLDERVSANTGDISDLNDSITAITEDVSDLDGRVSDNEEAIGGLKFVKITQSDYDNLSVKDPNTIYFIYD